MNATASPTFYSRYPSTHVHEWTALKCSLNRYWLDGDDHPRDEHSAHVGGWMCLATDGDCPEPMVMRPFPCEREEER